jgi:hypothetical protein
MFGRASVRRTQTVTLAVALFSTVLVGCSPPVPDPDPTVPPTESQATSVSPSPEPSRQTTDDSTTSSEATTTSEPTTTTSASPTDLEGICAQLYASRGDIPDAEDISDSMALEESWHSDLLTHALGSLPDGTPSQLTSALREARDLSARASQLYARRVIVSDELTRIQQRQDELSSEAATIAASVSAPSCGDLVTLP